MKSIAIFLLGSIALLSASCDKHQADVEFSLGEQFELPINETASCRERPLSLTFIEVEEDSRCPSDVVCVWSGRAVVKLEIHEGDTTEFISLSTVGEVEATFGENYRIRLLEVAPYPVSTATIPADAYVITLEVIQF